MYRTSAIIQILRDFQGGICRKKPEHLKAVVKEYLKSKRRGTNHAGEIKRGSLQSKHGSSKIRIMDWTNTHVTSTIYLCWAAQAGLYHHYGLKKRKLDKKMFGLFWHKVMNRKIPLVRGFDDMFLAPHSRHTEVPIEDIHNCKELTVLAESDEAGLFLAMADGGRKIFVMGHPEYDRVTLDGEYKRDVSKNLPIEIPENYYKDNNPENRPLLMWRAHANNLYTNWLNYYVYQSTPFDLYRTPDFSEI